MADETGTDSQGQAQAGGPGAPTGDAGTPAAPAAPAAPTGPGAGAGASAPGGAGGGEPAPKVPSGLPDLPPAVWDSEKNPYQKRFKDTRTALNQSQERLKQLEAEKAELAAKLTAPSVTDSRSVSAPVPAPSAGDAQGYSDEEYLTVCTRTLDQWKQDAVAQAQQQSDVSGVQVQPVWPTVEARRFAATMDSELARRGIPQPWQAYGMLVKRQQPSRPEPEPVRRVDQPAAPTDPDAVRNMLNEELNLRGQVDEGMNGVSQSYPQGFLQQKVTLDNGRTSTLGAALKGFCLSNRLGDVEGALKVYFTGFWEKAIAAKYEQNRPGMAAGQQFTGVRTSPIPQHNPSDDVQRLYEGVGMNRGGTSVAPGADEADWEYVQPDR